LTVYLIHGFIILPNFNVYQVQTAFINITIMSEVAHEN